MTQADGKIQYFLGANSAQGFVSLYNQLIDESKAAAFYILKGGPGCGKSTLMKKIGAELENEGVRVEYILCSGDPGSLDAILLPEKGIAIMDGTAPHVMEPTYPGVVSHYINLGDSYDRVALREKAASFIAIKKRYQDCYIRAYQCLRAAREVRRNGEKECITPDVLAKVSKRTKGILSREVKRKKGVRGALTQRFLGAITCEGQFCLYESVESQCKRIYELQDNGGLAHEMLRELQEGILAAGYDVTAFLSPEDPTRLDHLMVPALSLAFLSSTTQRTPNKRPYRRVRMETMADRELWKTNRAKLRFANRIAGELVEDGIRELAQAKLLHDDLEAVFHSFVDFGKVETMTQDLLQEIQAML